MGIVPGTFITSTTSLLLWFALLLLSQLRLMLMPSMVSMVMVLLVSTPMPPTPTLLPLLTLRFPHLPLCPLLVLLKPLCPLLLEDTLVLADMSPTLPESFMLPRERPRPRLTQLSSTELMDMLDTHMLESMEPMEPTLDTHTPMDTMERDLLRLSQRLMLLFSMEPMLDTPMPMEPTLMELTHTDMDMPGESNQ